MPTDRAGDVGEVTIARAIVTALAGPSANPDEQTLRQLRARLETAAGDPSAPDQLRHSQVRRLAIPALAAAAVLGLALTISMLTVQPATSPQPGQTSAHGAATAAVGSYVTPLRSPYTITSTFEERWGEFHYGVDLACPEETPFYAVHAGTITAAGDRGGDGLAVTLDAGDGIEIIYAHASSLAVTAGAHVATGELLGYVGHTGNSTGDHLHLEALVDGTQTDPVSFLRHHGVDLMAGNQANPTTSS